ncbi:Holliday junction branch migration protein RuvA [Desulfolucanica intricata]|uniref:Holliday junction branch migration protein RuvA n=1 Tax=Desulfolucanica intricata TaxID=1285191 RepID=UPI00082E2027|nr:Holliday junction branch migration protein RuvA [Desulfolucanica intricata]
MIAFLRGKILFIEEGAVILDVNGVGYRVFIPTSCLSRLPGPGEEVQMPTHMVVREDSMQLFGFSDNIELELFILLLNVSGVGPKGALAVLSTLSPQQLYLAVAQEDVKTITRVPGVGKKTAQRLILELKDKLKDRVTAQSEEILNVNQSEQTELEDTVLALSALGYSEGEAKAAVQLVIKSAGHNLPASDLLRLALQKLDAQG